MKGPLVEASRLLGVRVQVALYGSRVKTGRGHGTGVAMMLRLRNADPVTRETARIPATIDAIRRSRTLTLGGCRSIPFDPATGCRFHFSGTSL